MSEPITNLYSDEFDNLLTELEEMAAERGVDLKFVQSTKERSRHKITGSFVFKVTTSESGERFDPDQQRFIDLAPRLGVNPDWYGRSFRVGDKHYRVVGLLPNRPKNCVELENMATGRNAVCPPAFVANRAFD